MTFTAAWSPIVYYVRFNKNGAASGNMQDMKVAYDQAVNLTANTYKRSNYLFIGWTMSSDSNIVDFNNTASIFNLSTTHNEVINLYAVWRDTWANHYAKPLGKGTLDEPYLIDSAETLAWLAYYTENVGTLSGYFKQIANINLSTYEWLPIGNPDKFFMGIYDGNGCAIMNIKINDIIAVERDNIGLFGYAANGKLLNIRMMSGSVAINEDNSENLGAIVGYAENITIADCANYIKIEGNEVVGGVAGYINGGVVTGCYNYGDIGGSCVGGIAGKTKGEVKLSNSYINASITSFETDSYSTGCGGGLVGLSNSGTLTIESSAFEGSVIHNGKLTNCEIGIFIGSSQTTNLINCYANATINKENNYGLFTGSAEVLDCVFVTNGIKRCMGETFSEWYVTPDGRVLPAGLTWIAIGGAQETNLEGLIASGYTLVA